jgi:hypothetical protein
MSRRYQRGQVMPYVAVIILILTAATFVVFDLGRLVNGRIQSQNAADAAALAAVAVKVNKHHVDTLVRAAMTQEAILAQTQIRAAQAVALQAFVKGNSPVVTPIDPTNPDNPGGIVNPVLGDMKELSVRYKRYANLAYRHAVKLHRERIALGAWYGWLKREGAVAVQEAARVGFLTNIQGYDNNSDPALLENVEKVLSQPEDLLENSQSFGTNIGGTIYSDEGTALAGMFGKTFVQFGMNGVSSSSGTALLKYFDRYQLNASAAAQLSRLGTRNQMAPLSFLTMNWYSPRLVSIYGDASPDNNQRVAH